MPTPSVGLGISCFGGDRREAVDHGHGYASAVWPSLESLLAARHFDVVVVSPWSTAELVLDLVRRHAPDVPPSSSTPTTSTSCASSGPPPCREGAVEAADTKRRELAVYRRADRVVCVTDDDAAVVRAEIPDADIVVVPNAHAEVDGGPGFDERTGCLFVGNFNHPPNGDALAWWSQEIGPAPGRAASRGRLDRRRQRPAGGGGRRWPGPGITVTGARWCRPCRSCTRPGCRWPPCATARA